MVPTQLFACPGQLSNTTASCALFLCHLHKPYQCHPLSHSISSQFLHLLSYKHTGQIACKDNFPQSSYFVLLPRVLGQSLYSETYKFLFLSPSETSSIAASHVTALIPWGIFNNQVSRSSLAAPLPCRPPLICQACSFLPDGRVPSSPPSSRHPEHAFLNALPASSCWAKKLSLGVCPAPPSQKPDFILSLPSHPLWLVIALPLLVSDRK